MQNETETGANEYSRVLDYFQSFIALRDQLFCHFKSWSNKALLVLVVKICHLFNHFYFILAYTSIMSLAAALDIHLEVIPPFGTCFIVELYTDNSK